MVRPGSLQHYITLQHCTHITLKTELQMIMHVEDEKKKIKNDDDNDDE